MKRMEREEKGVRKKAEKWGKVDRCERFKRCGRGERRGEQNKKGKGKKGVAKGKTGSDAEDRGSERERRSKLGTSGMCGREGKGRGGGGELKGEYKEGGVEGDERVDSGSMEERG